MYISDLIVELEKIRNEHGNVQVCIEHGDDGGSYGTLGGIEDIFTDTDRNLTILTPGSYLNGEITYACPIPPDKIIMRNGK